MARRCGPPGLASRSEHGSSSSSRDGEYVRQLPLPSSINLRYHRCESLTQHALRTLCCPFPSISSTRLCNTSLHREQPLYDKSNIDFGSTSPPKSHAGGTIFTALSADHNQMHDLTIQPNFSLRRNSSVLTLVIQAVRTEALARHGWNVQIDYNHDVDGFCSLS